MEHKQHFSTVFVSQSDLLVVRRRDKGRVCHGSGIRLSKTVSSVVGLNELAGHISLDTSKDIHGFRTVFRVSIPILSGPKAKFDDGGLDTVSSHRICAEFPPFCVVDGCVSRSSVQSQGNDLCKTQASGFRDGQVLEALESHSSMPDISTITGYYFSVLRFPWNLVDHISPVIAVPAKAPFSFHGFNQPFYRRRRFVAIILYHFNQLFLERLSFLSKREVASIPIEVQIDARTLGK
mmetsp:Transcript_9022/g.13337  ORF Transcript_9022/g.13337 Transcript_9022/m.13337 type:complete len:236 (+) Transcript_9022:391-1098(+)